MRRRSRLPIITKKNTFAYYSYRFSALWNCYRSGSHITAQVPVYDSTGKVVAVLGVQKNIQGKKVEIIVKKSF
ncbi:MAG: hypothetical protein K6A43_07635 [Treponema sp.]|nr:hypothetical protein [Treponema sp.]